MAGMALVNAVGTAAGLFSMVSFVPQLWIVYGVMLKSWPVAASNSINLLLAAAILVLRWRYGEGEKP